MRNKGIIAGYCCISEAQVGLKQTVHSEIFSVKILIENLASNFWRNLRSGEDIWSISGSEVCRESGCDIIHTGFYELQDTTLSGSSC